MTSQELKSKCLQTRKDIINMISAVGSGHPGGSLSSVELMVGTYYTQMRVDPENPQNQSRDRFVLSKGHAAPCLYSILCRLGYFDEKELYSLRQIDGMLQGHPSVKTTPGIDASTGSLGQGCSIAVGMALASKCKGTDTRVYTILGDGECQEGQIWEAFMSAAHYKLDNLTMLSYMRELNIPGFSEYPNAVASASEDFANIAEKVPSTFMYLSAGFLDERGAYSAHNLKVRFNEDVCPIGAACLAQCAARWLESGGKRYLPNRSLYVPVRDNVSTSTSSSTR